MSDGRTYLQQHEMNLVKTHASGAQEWFCPICYRRFLLHFIPEANNINMLVLEDGDTSVGHIGNNDGHGVRISKIKSNDDEPEIPDDLLKSLEEALKDVDFDDL